MEVKTLKSANRKYCFISDTLFNDLKVEYKPGTGPVFTGKMNLVLTDPLYSTSRAWGQSITAHEVFSRRNTEDAVKLVADEMAFGAHEHIFCSDFMFFR